MDVDAFLLSKFTVVGEFWSAPLTGRERERVCVCVRLDVSLGGIPRERKMLKGHLPRVIYHQVLVAVGSARGIRPPLNPSSKRLLLFRAPHSPANTFYETRSVCPPPGEGSSPRHSPGSNP